MKHRFLCVCILLAGYCFVPIANAQNQPDGPAAITPGGYGTGLSTDSPYSQTAPSANQAVPLELVLPSGTLVIVRLSDALSSDRNQAYDSFTAILDQPLVAQGWVVARRGQAIVGQVAVAQKAGRVQGVSQLAVEAIEIVTVNGSQVPVRTELIRSSAGTSRARDAAGVGATTGIGAAIGGAAGGGEGAAIGAVAGAAAGIAGVLSTRGRATELYPETLLTFRLQAPAVISTQRAQHVFRPVEQADYNRNDGRPVESQPSRTMESHPPSQRYDYPPSYYPYYAYPFSYYYPGFGFYGYYGYGPALIVRPWGYGGGRGYYRGHH